MKYTRWALKDKTTGELISMQQYAWDSYLTPLEAQEPVIFDSREIARNWKNKEEKVVKVIITVKEAA